MSPAWTSPGCLALALALGACDASVTPIEVGAGCPERPERGPSQWLSNPDARLVDDFEHDDLLLPHVGGRDGAWILGSDSSSTRLTTESSDECAARGARAGHFAGRGFMDWGANWTAVMRNTPNGIAVGYDASEYTAISFWAAVGADTPAMSLPVGVTTVDVAWNGGVCRTCMDYYRTRVSLTPSWQRLVIRFDQLAQDGTGDPLLPLRRDQLVGFILWPDRDFDVWIDDVRFEP